MRVSLLRIDASSSYVHTATRRAALQRSDAYTEGARAAATWLPAGVPMPLRSRRCGLLAPTTLGFPTVASPYALGTRLRCLPGADVVVRRPRSQVFVNGVRLQPWSVRVCPVGVVRLIRSCRPAGFSCLDMGLKGLEPVAVEAALANADSG